MASLLGVILVLGVGFAAVRESSDLWESGIFTLAIATLLISILMAVHRTESRRAFWIGFALFGWICMVLSLVPLIESRLMTTKSLAYLESKMPGRQATTYTMWLLANGSGSPGNQVQSTFTGSGNQIVISRGGQKRLWDATTGRLLGGWAVRPRTSCGSGTRSSPCWRGGSAGTSLVACANVPLPNCDRRAFLRVRLHDRENMKGRLAGHKRKDIGRAQIDRCFG